MSFPSVKIGPGRSSRSHTAEEYIMLKEIEEAACKENLITLKAYILDAIKPKNNTFKI